MEMTNERTDLSVALWWAKEHRDKRNKGESLSGYERSSIALADEIERLQKECQRLLERGDKAELELKSLKAHYTRQASSGHEPKPDALEAAVTDALTSVRGTGFVKITADGTVRHVEHADIYEPPHWAEWRAQCTCPKPGTSSSTIDPLCPIAFPHPWQRQRTRP